MSAYLDCEPRTMRRALDETQAQIERNFKLIQGHYKAIDTLAGLNVTLEERAAGLGEALMGRRRPE